MLAYALFFVACVFTHAVLIKLSLSDVGWLNPVHRGVLWLMVALLLGWFWLTDLRWALFQVTVVVLPLGALAGHFVHRSALGRLLGGIVGLAVFWLMLNHRAMHACCGGVSLYYALTQLGLGTVLLVVVPAAVGHTLRQRQKAGVSDTTLAAVFD